MDFLCVCPDIKIQQKYWETNIKKESFRFRFLAFLVFFGIGLYEYDKSSLIVNKTAETQVLEILLQ